MKKRFAVLMAALAAVVSLGLTAPANAVDSDDPPPSVVQAENVDNGSSALPLPADVSGNMFWSPSICVQSPLNPTTYPVAAMAQQYNIKVGPPLALSFRADCSAAGYSASRSFTVTTQNISPTGCHAMLNTERAVYNGMWRWTNHPVVTINAYTVNCIQTQARRNHAISIAIGMVVGLKQLDGAGWNSRVMNNTAFSYDNVPTVTQVEADRVWSVITKAYGG